MASEEQLDRYAALARKKFQEFIGPRPLPNDDPNASQSDRIRALFEGYGLDYDEYQKQRDKDKVIYL